MIVIPECNAMSNCPKCAAPVLEFASIKYHAEVEADSCGSVAPCTALLLTTSSEEMTEFQEHLCKRCRRCGFGWVEQVAQERSVYEPCGCDDHGDHAGCDQECACQEDV